MTLTLHSHPLASFCQKVLIALYENGTPFDKVFVDLGDPVERDRFMKLSPLGLMPVLADSARGLQVVAVHSVDLSTAEAPSRGPRRDFGGGGGGRFGDRGDRGGFGGGGGYRDSGPSGPMVEGKVKFFNDQKGFGFVMSDSGSGDIYLHASALRRSGISAVEPDQRIRYSTRQGNKGVEVDRVELI